jgi:hypothetical protein
LIEQRLQAKLRKETDSVRRAEEAKKDKTAANRKEEDLQLKDSILKLRRTRLPLLSNFLVTSDNILPDDSSPPPSKDPLALAPRTHPPPLYFLPAILTPAQEAFLARRKAEVIEAVEKEWEAFREERTTGIEEIHQLRLRVSEEEARKKSERSIKDAEEQDREMVTEDAPDSTDAPAEPAVGEAPPSREVEMEVEEAPVVEESREEKKDDVTPMQADDDDAVEY